MLWLTIRVTRALGSGWLCEVVSEMVSAALLQAKAVKLLQYTSAASLATVCVELSRKDIATPSAHDIMSEACPVVYI